MAKKRLSDLLREEVNKSDANQPDEKSDTKQEADTPAKSAESSASPVAEPSNPIPPKNSAASKKADAKSGKSKAPETIADPPAEAPRGEPLRLGVHPNQQSKNQPSKNQPSQDQPSQNQPSQEAKPQSKEAEADSDNGTAKRTSPTKADLEGTIAQLKTELTAAQKQSQQQETQFAEQLDRLQTEMKRQQSVIDQLQAEVQHSKSLKAELEEARQVILKLSEINSKPIDAKYASSDGSKEGSKDSSKPTSPAPSQTTSQTTSQPKSPAPSQATNGAAPPASGHHLYVKAGESKPIDPSAAKPATSRFGAPLVPAPTNAAEPELESKPVQLKMPGANPEEGKLAPPARHQQELRRILDHPTRPGALPPMPTPSPEDKKGDKKLSETDMGWVD